MINIIHISLSLSSAKSILKEYGRATFCKDGQVPEIVRPWVGSFSDEFHMMYMDIVTNVTTTGAFIQVFLTYSRNPMYTPISDDYDFSCYSTCFMQCSLAYMRYYLSISTGLPHP